MYRTFFDNIDSSKNILILNSKPDGDSIGASLALNLLLKKLGKTAFSYSPSTIPDYLRFMTEKAEIKVVEIDKENLEDFDTILMVDGYNLNKTLAAYQGKYHPSAKFLVLDHHSIQNDLAAYTKLNLQPEINNIILDTQAESTCGMIVDIFKDYYKDSGNDLFDTEIAFLLYCGIVSDTDYFGYANVTKETFERAALLMQYKFDQVPIILKFRESLGYKAFKFIQRNIGRVIVNEEKHYAYLKIKKENLSEEDNLVNVNEATNYLNRALIRIIDIVDFSFIIKEINDSRCSIAMRKHNNGNAVDLSEITTVFGGGGHPQSAGGMIDKNIDQFEKELIEYLDRTLSK